jgi:ATP-binding cassette, subfamily C, bacterial LapB
MKGFSHNNLSDDADSHGFEEPPLGFSVYVASAVVNMLALALPLTILQIYDRVLPNSAFDTLTALVISLFGVIAIDGVLKYLRSYVANWSAASFTHKLSTRALSTMLNSAPSEFSRVTPSEHLERMGAISGLGSHLGGQSRLISIDVLFIPIFAGVIVLVGGSILLVMVVLFSLFGYIAFRRAKELNSVIADREQKDSRKYDFIIEILRAMQTVKAHAMEPLVMRRFERLQSAASTVTRRLIELTGAAQTYNAMYASLSVIAIVGVGALLVFDGRLTLGALACCMLLSSQLLQPLMRSLAAWNEIHLAAHRRTRIASIFSNDSKPNASLKAEPITYLQCSATPKEIEFKNVTIQRDGAEPLFKGLNLIIPAGRIIAIRGSDGSGRTSLLRTLVGDVTTTEGEVLLDGKVINGTQETFSRSAIRYVAPIPTTFRGTIIDNISLFGATSTISALSASKLIGLDDEIIRMPLGYDTMLKSSAGREIPAATAQRICIARAIATNPSVLIFDETNTLLDMSGERKFSEALRSLRKTATIILATHRPSLIRMADTVYDIEDGVLMRAVSISPIQKAVSA